MRFSSSRRTQRSDFDIVITSMLDINFLLIMFFMMTTAFQQFTSADLDLPQQPGERDLHPVVDDLIVNLTADGRIIVGDRTLDIDGLRTVMRDTVAHNEGGAGAVRVLLRADRQLPAARLNDVVVMIQRMGVGLGRFATEIPR